MSESEIGAIPPSEALAKSLPDFVYSVLRDEIIAGVAAPGESLRQAHIATRLSVSHAPVREALLRLENEGLATRRNWRGYVVAHLDVNEISDLFDMRVWLEGRACRLAASRRTDADIADAQAIFDRMELCTKRTPPDIVGWAHLNRDFHMVLLLASGRTHLRKIAAPLLASIERYVWLDHQTRDGLEISQQEHRRILDAFVSGDGHLLKKLAREHCHNTRDRLVQLLSRDRPAAH